MKKHSSEEALYERMRNLAQVNKTSLKESQNRTLGTLIDYKRAADGVAYGIVKEQHKYYIKKGGLNENLNVSDFAYIGGLSNITDYQYDKLAHAEKQMNMLLLTINEGISTKINKNGSKLESKKMLTEDKAGQEIEMAASKVNDLDAATDAVEIPAPEVTAPEGDAEMDAGLDAIPDETPSVEDNAEEIPAGEEMTDAGDEIADAGEEMTDTGEEIADTGEEMTDTGEEPKDEATREIEKSLGKLTNTLRKTELTEPQVKSYVNSFLSAFKDKFPDIDIEDRKEMAEKITKVVPPEEIEDLGQNVEDTEGNVENTDGLEEEQCAECGGFAQYAESRGYDVNSIKECGEEEMTNLISGYANANSEGQNDGDFKAIALFITPEIIEKLKNEYGHEEFTNQVEPFSTEMNEASAEDRDTQINELFGGLTNLAKQGAQKVANAATAVKQTYHAGELPKEIKKVEDFAAQLGQQIGALNKRMEKAGKQPINVGSILTTIKNQIAKGGTANLSQYTNEEGIPVDNTEVQPMMEEDVDIKVNEKAGKKLSPNNTPEVEMKESVDEKENDDLDIDNLDVSDDETNDNDENVLDLTKHEEPEMEIKSGFDSMGGGVVKPDGAPTTTVEVTKDSVNVTLSEGKEKPSAGLTKKEKSDVVKKAKKGEDIGKKGKGFEKVADKAAKEYGSKEKGEKVAAAAMWKNIKEGEEINETEVKLRKYIRNRLEEHAGIRKPSLNESVKSETLQKLDRIIDKQFKLFETDLKKKVK